MEHPDDAAVRVILRTVRECIPYLQLDDNFTDWEEATNPLRGQSPLNLLRAVYVANGSLWPGTFSDFRDARKVLFHAANRFASDDELMDALARLYELDVADALDAADALFSLHREWSEDFEMSLSLGSLTRPMFEALAFNARTSLDYLLDRLARRGPVPLDQERLITALHDGWTGALNSLLETVLALR